jgi:hypothetical protein
MRTIAAPMLCLALAVGCAPAPAPVEATAPAVPAVPAATTVRDAPPQAPAIAGEPCWPVQHERGPSPQYLPDSPVGVLVRFYELHAPKSGAGVPEAAELEAYKPLLTRPLLAALERARAERDAAIASSPGDKPPYVEGALFASLFEGYTQLQPLSIATEGWDARVPVCFAYVSPGGRSEWTDTVHLRKEDGVWRIDDVAYGANWDFANTGTLRDALPKGE